MRTNSKNKNVISASIRREYLTSHRAQHNNKLNEFLRKFHLNFAIIKFFSPFGTSTRRKKITEIAYLKYHFHLFPRTLKNLVRIVEGDEFSSSPKIYLLIRLSFNKIKNQITEKFAYLFKTTDGYYSQHLL